MWSDWVKWNISTTFDELVQGDDAVTPREKQDVDQLRNVVDSNTDEEGNDSCYDYKVLPTCHKDMEYWENYCHYLQNTSDVPEYIIKSLWDLQM
jgi:hypothetical protein